MEWGRSRSGCYLCFYQQKIEWVRLEETHPDLSELAKEYEEKSILYGDQIYWCQNESIAELEKPERVATIKASWVVSQERNRARRKNMPLVETLGGLEPEDAHLRDGCLIFLALKVFFAMNSHDHKNTNTQ